MLGLKEEKLIRKQTYTKTEAYKLYSRLFWTFLQNIIKIYCCNFELYRFKVYAIFWDTVYVTIFSFSTLCFCI